MLEIGSGWGGFAVYLAGELGCRVTTVTVSKEQHEYVEKLVVEHGLVDRVDARLQDFRTIEGSYDRIAGGDDGVDPQTAVEPVLPAAPRARVPEDRSACSWSWSPTVTGVSPTSTPTSPDASIFLGGQVPAPRALRELAARHRLAWREDEGFGARTPARSRAGSSASTRRGPASRRWTSTSASAAVALLPRVLWRGLRERPHRRAADRARLGPTRSASAVAAWARWRGASAERRFPRRGGQDEGPAAADTSSSGRSSRAPASSNRGPRSRSGRRGRRRPGVPRARRPAASRRPYPAGPG